MLKILGKMAQDVLNECHWQQAMLVISHAMLEEIEQWLYISHLSCVMRSVSTVFDKVQVRSLELQ